MQEYLNLLEKYECKLIDGKVVNRHGKDTRILWGGLNAADINITGFSNTDSLKKELCDTLEDLLKITYDRK